jgi:hypothetical protein
MVHEAPRKLSIHGLAVELRDSVSAISPAIDRLVRALSVPAFPSGFVPASGAIRLYDPAEVSRHLSPTARMVATFDDLAEVYAEGERFWLVDDRWGLLELDLLKSRWRAWVLPTAAFNPDQVVEAAVYWPLAQLLRSRGLHLVPAVSVERQGFGALVICPYSPEPELAALVQAGYRIIGPRWTALREEENRISMMRLPGRVERLAMPIWSSAKSQWIDLTSDNPWAEANHAFCSAIIIVEPGRRQAAGWRDLDTNESNKLLKHTWPIVELPVASARSGRMTTRLAAQCRCLAVRLSRHPNQFVTLLDAIRKRPPAAMVLGRPVTVRPAGMVSLRSPQRKIAV